MRPMTLRARMFAWFVALAAFLVCAMSTYYYRQTKHMLIESLDADLRLRAEEIHAGLDAGKSPEELVAAAAAQRRLRSVAVILLPGPVDAARSAVLRRFAATIPAERLVNLSTQPRGTRGVSVEVRPGRHVRVTAEQFPRGDGSGGSVVVGVAEHLTKVAEEMEEVLMGVAIALPIALALACWGAWLAARHLTRPIRQIGEAAGRIEFGGEQVPIPGSDARDEVGRLAGTLERTFARLREAYERQERFSADAAHELRTPVSIVISQAEVALRRERTAPEYRDALQHVLDAARRMQETVDSLLLLARGGAGELTVHGRRADLVDVCHRLLPELDALGSPRGVGVALETVNGSVVAGDAALLSVLVRNVAVNALDHSPPQAKVRIGVAGAEGEVVLRVRDEGPGIPEAVRERVFDRFFRTDDSRSRATGGSGPGLSIVRLIAEIHGGTARVVDADGPGACVEVRIPRAPAG